MKKSNFKKPSPTAFVNKTHLYVLLFLLSFRFITRVIDSMSYDVLIIGAGLAGLRTGIKILTDHPHLKCIILEKYNYNGGRVITYHKTIPGVGKVQWENGAGRISTTHKKVLGLLKQYGLTTYPISGDVITDKLQPNRFSDLHDVYLKPLRGLPLDVLQTHTLGQISDMVLGSVSAREFYSLFPYFSEVHTLRADQALYSFDHEMGSMSGFVGCREGMSAIIDGMVQQFLGLGGTIEHGQEVISVSSLENKMIEVTCKERDMKYRQTFVAPICVMALHCEAMKHIRGVSHLPVLNKVVMTPLLRMYAVFPVQKGKSWFSGMSKIVTPDPIRFMIPIDHRTIMISYTDGNDARYWMRKDQSKVEGEVMHHIRSFFPDLDIPDPIFFKTHPWTDGCTYWKPGRYDVIEESDRSLHPDPINMGGLFLCGESFAPVQCWMESAIEQSDRMIGSVAFRKALKSIA